MPDDEQKPPYEVGYRKPPRHSRFKPGQSGNPKGKPRGAKNLATVVGNAIREKVIVTENGKRKKVSKLEVAIKQMVNKATSGDQKAMLQLLPLVQLIEGKAEAVAASTPMAAEADQLGMQGILERLRHGDGPKEAEPEQKDVTSTPDNKETNNEKPDTL